MIPRIGKSFDDDWEMEWEDIVERIGFLVLGRIKERKTDEEEEERREGEKERGRRKQCFFNSKIDYYIFLI